MMVIESLILRSKSTFYNYIIFTYRAKRLLTYRCILKRRLKALQKELLKPEMVLVPAIELLKKIMAKEKLIYPRLDIFEQIVPSSKA